MKQRVFGLGYFEENIHRRLCIVIFGIGKRHVSISVISVHVRLYSGPEINRLDLYLYRLVVDLETHLGIRFMKRC